VRTLNVYQSKPEFMDKWWEVVPEQISGGETDAVSKVQCKTIEEAREFYALVRSRLMDVNNWGSISDTPLSSFALFDSTGTPANRGVQEGDFISIDIPGPGLKVGKGFDWVNVTIVREEMIDEGYLFSIQVRPSAHPNSAEGKTPHFLDSGATSTFQIRRIGTSIYAEEHARNESPNLQTGNILDNLRNGVVGTAAAIGLSYPQWKSLVKGLVKK
jgi:hypothetical protein